MTKIDTDFTMTAADFTAWVAHMKATRKWSEAECAAQLSCGVNQITRWKRAGCRRYIGYACAAIAYGLPPWKAVHSDAPGFAPSPITDRKLSSPR